MSTLGINRFKLLQAERRRCAVRLLELYKTANAGHIGSSLSCLDLLVDLLFARMKADDKLILSKGHAAGALYTTLSLSGRMPEAALDDFYKEGTLLAAHPPCSGKIGAIPFGTGSLGHGLGLACGLAYSQRFSGRDFSVYVILSEGDCNEGSTWEAALFAGHHKLKNLVVLVDANGIQGIDYTKSVLDLLDIKRKFEAFGFDVAVANNGNDFASLNQAYEALNEARGAKCIVAKTVKGHGVSFMEDKVEWHYLPMSEEQFRLALLESDALNE